MNPVELALSIMATPVSPATYVRQKSNLLPAQVGRGQSVSEIEAWDADIAIGLASHIIWANSQIDEAAGTRFDWPFDEVTAALLWPLKTVQERETDIAEIATLAAEAVIRRGLGDLKTGADTRAGLVFSQQGRDLYNQAQTFIDAAKAKIATALKRLQNDATSEAASVSGFSSVSVPIVSTW